MDTSADIAPHATDDDGSESEPPPRLLLETVVEEGDWPSPEDLELLVHAVSVALVREPELAGRLGEAASACVAFTIDREVHELNKRYRSKDKPTNVLSFPAPPPDGGRQAEPRHLGDVVLAAETVAAEAKELGISLADHVQHLVMHGVLHLLGHDHETDAEAEAMEALETRLLATLGIADPHRNNE